MTSASSRWPFPATPATPTISPERIENETSRSASPPRSPGALAFCSSSIASPSECARWTRVASAISRPTMSEASERGVTSSTATVSTDFPPRRTVMRSATAITSWSLCVMTITECPSRAITRSVLNNPSASCGVRTAVGSSRISTREPRKTALTISTRCCSPTESCQIRASGSTCSWSASETSRTSRRPGLPPSQKRGRCQPSRTFSATVSVSTSRKC